MRKGIKFWVFRLPVYLLTVLFTLVLTLVIFLQIKPVQTFLGRAVAAHFSHEWGVEVRLAHMEVNYDASAQLSGLYIEDQMGNTLLSAKKLRLRLPFWFWPSGKIIIDKLEIEETSFNLLTYETHPDELNLNFIIEYFNGSNQNDTTHSNFELRCNNLIIKNVNFEFWNQLKDDPSAGSMDFAHLNIRDIHLTASNFEMVNDSFAFRLEHLKALDTCGFTLNHMEGIVHMSPSGLMIDRLHIQTPGSDLSMRFMLEYEAYADFLDFVEKVRFNTVIGSSQLQLADIGYFAPVMFEMNNRIELSGDFYGAVNNLRTKNFKCSFGGNSNFHGNLRMTGLPDIYETFVIADIKELETTAADLENFNLPGAELKLPDIIDSMGLIRINGNFTGFYNDFLARAIMKSSKGSLQTNLELNTHPLEDSVSYKGSISIRELSIGELLGQAEKMGPASGDLYVKGTGLNPGTLTAYIKGDISSFQFNEYDYRDIRIDGNYQGEKFEGFVSFDDPNLKFDFQGLVDFHADKRIYDFEARVQHADFYRLNLTDRDTVSNINLSMKVNVEERSLQDIRGDLILDSLTYREGKNSASIRHLEAGFRNDSLHKRSVDVRSEKLDLSWKGKYQLDSLITDLVWWYDRYLDTADFNRAGPTNHDDFELNLVIRDINDWLAIFYDKLRLQDSVNIQVDQSLQAGLLRLGVEAPAFSLYGIEMESANLLVLADSGRWNNDLQIKRLIFMDSTSMDSLQLGLDNFSISTSAAQNFLTTNLDWKNEESELSNYARLNAYYQNLSENQQLIKFSTSEIMINDTLWVLNPEHSIELDSGRLVLNNFIWHSNWQRIGINGQLPRRNQEQLDLTFENWDLSNFDILTQSLDLDFDGIMDGELSYYLVEDQPVLLSDISVEKLGFNKQPLGLANFYARWNDTSSSVYVNAEIKTVGNVGERKMLDVVGTYHLNTKEKFDITVGLENFKLKALDPLVRSQLSYLDGYATGKLHIGGSPEIPDLRGSLQLKRTEFRVKYLNTMYSLSHDFEVLPDRIEIADLIVYDTLGQKIRINGKLVHDRFSKIFIDVKLEPEQFSVLNTRKGMNDLFYGQANASGRIFISGAPDDIIMKANLRAFPPTDLTIPISSSYALDDNYFIIFVSDTARSDTTGKPQLKAEGFSLDMQAQIERGTQTNIILPANMGSIESQGFGVLDLVTTKTGAFRLNGEYTVTQGTLFLNFQNLIRKKFDLTDGGRIQWTGNPYDAMLSMEGRSRVKANLASLGIVIDSASDMRNRVSVDCIIRLSGPLTNPNMWLGIDLPTADVNVQQLVYATLDTTNQALMTQQVISLLVLGSFSYSNAQNVTLGNTTLNMFSGQLSNWLSKISNDFDIGIHYKPGDNVSSDELEVALTTQLFDDRLTIDGNFGMVNDARQQNSSNIVGDVDITYRISKSGRLKLKAFNQSNVNSWYNTNAYENLAPYTQGVGIVFSQDFDNFGDLFRKKKKKSSEFINHTGSDEEILYKN